MNDLSWLIYMADILPNITRVFAFMGVLFGFVFAVYAIVVTCSDTYSHKTREENEMLLKSKKELPNKLPLLVIPVILLFVSAIIPSKETIYLIAGSEAGEAVVASEQGQEVLNDIQLIIKQQLSNMKEAQ